MKWQLTRWRRVWLKRYGGHLNGKLPTSKTIKELAELLSETGLTEIEIETGDMRIKVAREVRPSPPWCRLHLSPRRAGP